MDIATEVQFAPVRVLDLPIAVQFVPSGEPAAAFGGLDSRIAGVFSAIAGVFSAIAVQISIAGGMDASFAELCAAIGVVIAPFAGRAAVARVWWPRSAEPNSLSGVFSSAIAGTFMAIEGCAVATVVRDFPFDDLNSPVRVWKGLGPVSASRHQDARRRAITSTPPATSA